LSEEAKMAYLKERMSKDKGNIKSAFVVAMVGVVLVGVFAIMSPNVWIGYVLGGMVAVVGFIGIVANENDYNKALNELKKLPKKIPICPNCEKELPQSKLESCPFCGKPLLPS